MTPEEVRVLAAANCLVAYPTPSEIYKLAEHFRAAERAAREEEAETLARHIAGFLPDYNAQMAAVAGSWITWLRQRHAKKPAKDELVAVILDFK